MTTIRHMTREEYTALESAVRSIPTPERRAKGDIQIHGPADMPGVDVVNERSNIPTAKARRVMTRLMVMESLGYLDHGYVGYVNRYISLQDSLVEELDVDADISSIYRDYVPEGQQEVIVPEVIEDQQREAMFVSLIRYLGRERCQLVELVAATHPHETYHLPTVNMLGNLTPKIERALEALKFWFDAYDKNGIMGVGRSAPGI